MTTFATNDSGTSRADLGQIASAYYADSRRKRQFAALMAAGHLDLGDLTSGEVYVDGSGVLVDPDTEVSKYLRVHGQVEPPHSTPTDYSKITFACADFGREITWDEDSDEAAAYRRSGQAGMFLQRKTMQGMNYMARGFSLFANAKLAAGSSPFTPSDRSAAAYWDAATTYITTDLNTALTNLGDNADAVYTTWKVWRIFKQAAEIWESFGGTAGLGQLSDAQAAQAMANITGCDPANIFVTGDDLGLGAHMILYKRGSGTADPRVSPCGMVAAYSTLDEGTPPGIQGSAGTDPMAPSIGGIRVGERARGYTGKGLYVRWKADFQVVPAAGVRVKGIHS